MECYLLQPVKSVIVAMLKHCKDQAKLSDEINITMNGVKMPVVKEAMNMGIDSQESAAVTYNIENCVQLGVGRITWRQWTRSRYLDSSSSNMCVACPRLWTRSSPA